MDRAPCSSSQTWYPEKNPACTELSFSTILSINIDPAIIWGLEDYLCILVILRIKLLLWMKSIVFINFNGIKPHETPSVSICILVGGFNPSEKYESQLGLLFPINGKS
jgi:hypothetical protein